MHKILDYLTKVIGWLQIVASPLLFGLGIGAIIFFPNPTTTRLIIGISIATLGLVLDSQKFGRQRRDNRVYVKNFSNSRT